MPNLKNKLKLLLVIAFFSLTVFPTLGRVSLWEIDEGRYLGPARNAIEYGKWLIPEYNGGPRIQKPPLMVWLVAASSFLVNNGKVDEFSARLPSALAALGVLLLVYIMVVQETEDEELALWSVFVLSSSLLFVKHARFAITDMVLLFFITATIFSLTRSIRTGRGTYLYLAAIFSALGFLVKGPVAVVVPGIIYLLLAYSERELSSIPWKHMPFAFLLFLTLALPWPLLAGREFWREFILRSNLQRAVSNPSWKTSIFFYITNFPAHFVVPSVLIPATACALKRYSTRPLTLFAVWFASVFVLFSIFDTKRSSYILPAYPAAAVLVAFVFVRAFKSVKCERFIKLAKHLVFAVFTGIYLWFIATLAKYKAPAKFYLLASVCFASILTILWLSKKKPKHFIVLSCAIFALTYTNLYQPVADKIYHSPKICIERMKSIVGNAPLYIYGSLRANEYWYWQRRTIPDVEGALTTPYYFYTRKKHIKLYGLYRKILCCAYQKERLCLYKME